MMYYVYLLQSRKRPKRAGQVATFLLLILVGILIFAMATANLGQVSEATLTVANAADASTLQLGSQLASISNQICQQLTEGNPKAPRAPDGGPPDCNPEPKYGLESCVRTGILGTLLAVLAVVIIIALPGAAPGGIWLLGAVGAGAKGGFEGIADKSWGAFTNGALQGFAIGVGIGGGLSSLTNLGGAFGGTTLASTQYTGIATLGATAPSITFPLTATAIPAVTTATALGVGTAAGLVGGNASYSGLQADHQKRLGQRALLRRLNNLAGDYERIREGVLLQALNQVVEDPNRTRGPGNPDGACYFPNRVDVNGDPFDFDEDLDLTESIPCLDYWWSVRVNTLASNQLLLAPLITDFMEGPADFVPDSNPKGQSLKSRLGFALGALDYLERNEVECACQGSGGAIRSEGPTVTLFRRLDDAGLGNPAIFQPGPDQDTVRAFYNDPCNPTCPAPPPGWDSVDAVRSRYEEFIQFAAALVYNPIIHGPRGFATPQEWYRNLARTVDIWLPRLYDPQSTTTAYGQLGFIGGEINGWFLWTRDTVIPSLPMCKWYRSGAPLVFAEQKAPICENTQYVGDKDIDPIYPCTWENNSGPNANLVNDQRFLMDNYDPDIESNFPGPVCKIDWNDRDLMFKEMDAVKQFVKSPNLENFILADPDRHFDKVFGSGSTPCDAAGDQVLTLPEDVTLLSIDEVGFIQWDGGRVDPPELRYVYTYEYQCCVGACPGTQPPYTKQKQDTEATPFPGSVTFATQMRTPSNEFPTAQKSFIGVLDAYRDILGQMRIKPPHNRFASTDFDWYDPTKGGVPSDEFGDAIGWLFITNAEPYFFNEEEDRWAGTAAIPFFRLNLEGFYQAVQNQIATALPKATDGRLPNPTQIINDPIRGEHPVDGLYTWRDSNGVHSVNVEIGPFIKADTKEENRGIGWLWGKKCTVLTNYCENTPGCPYSFGSDRTWVRIARRDPTNTETGFWKWNPFGGTIRKAARAYYDRLAVGLCGTGDVACP